jgi:CRP/FNR family transcriptional regulator, cyclic AMP receptor protein
VNHQPAPPGPETTRELRSRVVFPRGEKLRTIGAVRGRLLGESSSSRENSMRPSETIAFDPAAFLEVVGDGRTVQTFQKDRLVFAQGDAADSVYYVERGKVKLAVVSPRGKEAVIAILSEGSFFGEGCLAGQPVRMATASAMGECTIVQVRKASMIQTLHREPEFAESFITHLLTRNIRIEEDLIDHLFNSSEKRLARVLLLLANFGKAVHPDEVIPNISQETLAEMIGTTRSRVSFFLNKFRKLGFIEYNGGGMHVDPSLLNVILHD